MRDSDNFPKSSVTHGAAIGQLLVLAVILAAAGGWIANIVKICGALDAVVNGMFIARCIDVFLAPLGAVLGYF